jgi:hypothetical protein
MTANMESDFLKLSRYLRQWDWQRRKQQLLDWLPRSFMVALGISLAVGLLSRSRPFLTRQEIILLTIGLILMAVSATTMIVLLHRRSLWDQARFADRRLDLRERATTAVEIQINRLQTSPDLASRQLQDAVARVQEIDPKQRLPLTVPLWGWLPVVVGLALLGLLLWLPNHQEQMLLEQRALAAAIADQVAELEALSNTIANDQTLTAEQQSALQQPIKEAITTLEGETPSREAAVAALSAAETELRNLGDQFDTQSLTEALKRSAPAAGQGDPTGSLSQSLASGQLDAAAAALANLAQELTALDHGSQQELSDSLANAAAAIETSDDELAGDLQAAADALAEGDVTAAQAALTEAATLLQERNREQAAADQARQAAASIGAARQEIAQSGEQPNMAGDSTVTSNAGNEQGASTSTGDQESNSEGTGGGTSEGQQPGSGGLGQGGGATENVFVPPSIDLNGLTGVDLELPVQCLGDPDSCGPPGELVPADPNDPERFGGSIVPYERVFGIYRATANEALTGGGVPLGLQDLVRDYFSSLEP